MLGCNRAVMDGLSVLNPWEPSYQTPRRHKTSTAYRPCQRHGSCRWIHGPTPRTYTLCKPSPLPPKYNRYRPRLSPSSDSRANGQLHKLAPCRRMRPTQDSLSLCRILVPMCLAGCYLWLPPPVLQDHPCIITRCSQRRHRRRDLNLSPRRRLLYSRTAHLPSLRKGNQPSATPTPGHNTGMLSQV